MKQSQIAKTFEKIECPHCQKTIHIGIQTMIPLLSYSTPEQLVEAKEELKKRLDNIEFKDPESKADIYKWLENTPIEIGDIEGVIRSILNNYGKEPESVTPELNQ